MIRAVWKATCGTTAVAVALTACSSTGGSPRPAPVSPLHPDAHAEFIVHWPSEQQEQSVRKRDTISPSTLSITVSVNGANPRVVNKPVLSGSPSTTSVSIDAPVGTDSFTFQAWDQPGGAGNVLDEATVSQSIVANATNAVSVALDGVCSGLVPSLTTASTYGTATSGSIALNSGSTQTVLSSLRMVGPFPATINVNEVDAAGNTLLASSAPNPIVLTESGTKQHVTIAPVAATAGNTKFTLTPISSEPDGNPTTITATSASCGTGSAFFPNSFTLATSAIVYVADSLAGIIAFDQDGTQVAKISAVTGITGLAYNSKSPSLIAIAPKSGTSGAITFQTLSLTGTSLGSGSISTSIANPVGNIAYNPLNGYVLVAFREYTDASGNVHYGSVLEYTIAGSTATSVTPTGTNPFLTGSIAPPPYDPDCFLVLPNSNVIVGDSMTNSYLFDSNGNYLYASVYDASNTLALDTLRGNILDFSNPYYGYEFSETTLSNVTNNNLTFPSNSYSADYDASAYNQGEDELYGFAPNVAFGLSGSVFAALNANNNPPSNLPSGAFPGLASPSQALVLP